MKKNLLSVTAILAIGFFTNNAVAQTTADTGTGTAFAKLIKPMTVAEDAALNFGTINVQTGAAGTVLLESTLANRINGGGVALSAVAPFAANGAYSVTGTKNTIYELTLPTKIEVKETIDGVGAMDITALKARFNGKLVDAVNSKLDGSGNDSFTLGGTLNVGLNQIPGEYAGTFLVTVDYN